MRPAGNSRGAAGNRGDATQRNINNDKKGQAGKVYAAGVIFEQDREISQ
jgi:hypothetical protein